ncbi:TIGR04255 family protein [Rhodanobacter sp. FW102-FHT14D06]|uniref:TIGR04255 family protein n=2 Tax=unclassified Rhodanobacter TaxID=2621553 RepID=A0AB74UUI6_9GAMM
MNETFRNAPLVEIVAELRWQVPQLAAADQAGNPIQLPIVLADNAMAALFHRTTTAVGNHGFDRLEQLVPPGSSMPVLLPQMMYRYRRTDEVPVLAQIGPGMFSVNALPPYKSWKEFHPHLEGGVEGLLEALTDKPELNVNLRYIDAFKHALTSGRDAKAFATEVLGFCLELPPTLQARLTEGVQARMSFQVGLPVPGMAMTITVSDGRLGTDSVVLMNTDVRIENALPSDKQAILSALDKAHDLIHGTFVDMTQSIQDKLQSVPVGGNA